MQTRKTFSIAELLTITIGSHVLETKRKEMFAYIYINMFVTPTWPASLCQGTAKWDLWHCVNAKNEMQLGVYFPNLKNKLDISFKLSFYYQDQNALSKCLFQMF